ncbi:MAG: CPBP family intramembrane metalloprotease [Ruminococcus sp.]|nr:CPBP family intramembrane metalloprotease [Ruminococcus sp.]
MIKDKKLTLTLIAYVIIFYGVWAARMLLFDPFSEFSPALGEFLRELIKFSVWFVPAWILIGKYNKFMYVKREEFFNIKIRWLKILPVFIFFTLIILMSSFRLKGRIAVSEEFGAADIIIVLFVGITEETVFRGWLLNGTYTENGKIPALVLNALLFLAVHFPIWIKNGVFAANMMSGGFFSIMVLSFTFGFIFTKTRSILPVVLLHMYWDLLVFTLQ